MRFAFLFVLLYCAPCFAGSEFSFAYNDDAPKYRFHVGSTDINASIIVGAIDAAISSHCSPPSYAVVGITMEGRGVQGNELRDKNDQTVPAIIDQTDGVNTIVNYNLPSGKYHYLAKGTGYVGDAYSVLMQRDTRILCSAQQWFFSNSITITTTPEDGIQSWSKFWLMLPIYFGIVIVFLRRLGR